MISNTIKLLLTAAAAAMLASCTQSNTWTVDGTIDGADNQALVLEA